MNKLAETDIRVVLNRVNSLGFEYFWRTIFSDVQFRIWVLDLVRQDQLFKKGIDGDGDIIGYYSQFTESINPTKIEGTPYTLYDTGEFYKSFVLYVYTDAVEIDANPIKVNYKGEKENLFWKYGENIIALTGESMGKLQTEIRIRMDRQIRVLLQIN